MKRKLEPLEIEYLIKGCFGLFIIGIGIAMYILYLIR